jgi:hypothetical protein
MMRCDRDRTNDIGAMLRMKRIGLVTQPPGS